MRTRWLLLLLVLTLAGCRVYTGSRHRHGGGGAGGEDAEAEAVAFGHDGASRRPPTTDDGIVVEADLPPTEHDGDADLLADPHTKRPGTTELEEASEQHTVTFSPPDAKLQPLRREKRPALPQPATLCVAFVRDGEQAFKAKAVLELEELLAKESAIKLLASLPQSPLRHAGLTELAAQAHEDGWDLLLVDVRSSDTDRIGYLVHAKSGRLLARYDKTRKGVSTTPASTGPVDLCQRLATTYSQLTQ